MKKHWVWPLLMMSLVWGSAFGAIEAQDFPSEAVKTRYYDLIATLRCPQCLNTNLAGSDAMIAQNLRSTVLRLLVEGKSDDEVKQFLYEVALVRSVGFSRNGIGYLVVHGVLEAGYKTRFDGPRP